MILWFTGQPGSGKTTLCNELKEKILYSHYYLKGKIIHFDGDDIRDVKDSALGLNFIEDLRPVTFNWKF